MPLSNNTIIKLNEITTFVNDKNSLKESEVDEIKKIFQSLLERGDRYDVEEIEYWLENEGSWKNKDVRIRITNISHYIQSKYDQTSHLRIISNHDESCGDSCSCGH